MSRPVPAPPRLRLLERPVSRTATARPGAPPGTVVHVDVAGGDARHVEPLGKPGQPAIPRPVVPPERPLELDPEPLAPEGGTSRRPSAIAAAVSAALAGPRPSKWARAPPRERSRTGTRAPRPAR